MNAKIKVSFIISELQNGGAEKVLVNILNNLSQSKFEVDILTFKKSNEENVQLHANISHTSLNLKRVRYFPIKFIKFLIQSRASIIFVFNVNHINILIPIIRLFKRKTLILTRETTILSLLLAKYNSPKRWLFKILHTLSFYYAHRIVALSKEMVQDLVRKFGVNNYRISLIRNPIDIDDLVAQSQEYDVSSSHKFNISAIGRIIPEKGFDKIIQAFSLLKRKDVKLFIIGGVSKESPYHFESLKELVGKLNLEEHVEFTGYLSNPYPYICKSTILVMASKFEGLPNVAIEANALGVPVIGLKCPGGLKDIIVEGVNGRIIQGDIKELSFAIEKALSSDFSKKTIVEMVRFKYSVKDITQSYENLLEDVYYTNKHV